MWTNIVTAYLFIAILFVIGFAIDYIKNVGDDGIKCNFINYFLLLLCVSVFWPIILISGIIMWADRKNDTDEY